jgi:hypothetical protein
MRKREYLVDGISSVNFAVSSEAGEKKMSLAESAENAEK